MARDLISNRCVFGICLLAFPVCIEISATYLIFIFLTAVRLLANKMALFDVGVGCCAVVLPSFCTG